MTGTLPKLLIVDDEADSLRWFRAVFQRRGFTVVEAATGDEALRAAAAEAPDLIFLDMVMPVMDGLEVCRRLKADPALKDIPVLFLSAYSATEERIAGFRAGAVDFLQKPFTEEEVVLRIQTHWDLRRLRMDLEAQVKDRTQALQAAVEDKKLLMRELQHRVKNHLTLVTGLLTLTEASGTGRETQGELLEKARSRIMALAAVYDLLYHPENLTDIDFEIYAGKLLEPWVESSASPDQGISVECRVLPIRLPPDTLIPLGLIVTELMTNAFKYAFPLGGPGKVVLQLTREEGDLVLTLSDNGCGMPKNVGDEGRHGLGWDLVGVLTRQLRGRWSHTSARGTADSGTTVQIRFPAPSAPPSAP